MATEWRGVVEAKQMSLLVLPYPTSCNPTSSYLMQIYYPTACKSTIQPPAILPHPTSCKSTSPHRASPRLHPAQVHHLSGPQRYFHAHKTFHKISWSVNGAVHAYPCLLMLTHAYSCLLLLTYAYSCFESHYLYRLLVVTALTGSGQPSHTAHHPPASRSIATRSSTHPLSLTLSISPQSPTAPLSSSMVSAPVPANTFFSVKLSVGTVVYQ